MFQNTQEELEQKTRDYVFVEKEVARFRGELTGVSLGCKEFTGDLKNLKMVDLKELIKRQEQLYKIEAEYIEYLKQYKV